MTLAQLSITVALLAALGLLASRLGLSAIPAYLLAGLLLGPNEPRALSLIRPSEVTDFVAEIGLVFLALLPRSGVHARTALPQPAARAGRWCDRPACERRSRPDRGRRCIRLQLRRARARGGDLRLFECDHGKGADRLPTARRRGDRPRAGDPGRGSGSRRAVAERPGRRLRLSARRSLSWLLRSRRRSGSPKRSVR
jgi:hypothetical protein